MIVTCERCATQFQLDDARIPPGGVRVRCSRCKHAFEIRLPEPGAPDPCPESSSDDVESDWQFNQEVPGEKGGDTTGPQTGPGASGSVVDSLLGDAPGEAQDEEPTPGSGATFTPSGLELEDDPPAAGGTPDPEPDPAPEPQRELKPEEEDEPLAVETRAEPLFSGSDDDAGAAPEFLFESPVPDGTGSDGPARSASEIASDWDELASEGTHAREPFAEASDLAPSRVPHTAPLEVSPGLSDGESRWQARLAQGANAAGWGVVIALFAFGLYGGLFPATRAEPRAPELGDGLELRDLSGRFVEHVAAGPLYVVSGRLLNTTQTPTRIPWLSVELVSRSGQAVADAAPLGLPRAPRDLRESPLEALARGRPLAGAHRTFRPGEERAFEAVLGPVPSGAADFRIVAGGVPTSATTAGVSPESTPPAPEPPSGAQPPDAEAPRRSGAAPAAPPAAPAP